MTGAFGLWYTEGMDIALGDFYGRLVAVAVIVALGFLLSKVRWLDEGANKKLINLLLMVFMPAALFSAFPTEFSEGALDMFLAGLWGGVAVMVGLIIVSRMVFNKWLYKGEIRYEAQFALIFNNATFLGYPIVAASFGAAGLVPYCGFIVAFNVALFSYGVFLFERRLSWRLVRDTVLNPNIIAVALGMLVFLMNWQVPMPASEAVGFLGGAMTPLSLICIGYMLSHARILQVFRKWRLFLAAAVQLFVGPLLAFWLLTALHMPREVIVICTLIQALPTATSLGLFAKKYGGNDIEASELVAISTVLSVGTLPLMVWLLLA